MNNVKFILFSLTVNCEWCGVMMTGRMSAYGILYCYHWKRKKIDIFSRCWEFGGKTCLWHLCFGLFSFHSFFSAVATPLRASLYHSFSLPMAAFFFLHSQPAHIFVCIYVWIFYSNCSYNPFVEPLSDFHIGMVHF